MGLTTAPLSLVTPGRMHEVSGAGAVSFAAIVAAASGQDLLWVRPRWEGETLNPVGLLPFLDPAKLLIAQVKDQIEALAVGEDALRDGALGTVIIEVIKPLSLTAGRRLQLAAKAGRATGLCVIPEGMGCNAAETRWQCSPVYDPAAMTPDSTPMRWELTKNKSGTTGVWHVRWERSTTGTAHRLRVVPPVGKRPGASDARR